MRFASVRLATGPRLRGEETGPCPNWERPEQVATDIGAFLPGR